MALKFEQKNWLLSRGLVVQKMLGQAILVKGEYAVIAFRGSLMKRHQSSLRLDWTRAIGDWHLARSGQLGEVPISSMKGQSVG